MAFFEGYDILDKNTVFPQLDFVECLVVKKKTNTANKTIVTIDIGTLNGLNAENGMTLFDVYAEQITERG